MNNLAFPGEVYENLINILKQHVKQYMIVNKIKRIWGSKNENTRKIEEEERKMLLGSQELK